MQHPPPAGGRGGSAALLDAQAARTAVWKASFRFVCVNAEQLTNLTAPISLAIVSAAASATEGLCAE